MQIGKQKKHPYIVFLSKQKMMWLGETLKNAVVMEFFPEGFQDLEFKSSKGIQNQLGSAVEQKALKPHQVIVVLSEELFFSQDITQQSEEQIKAYLGIVPFDEVISKEFIFQTQKILVAISKDLLDPLLEILESQGFELVAVVPNFIFGEQLKTVEQFTVENIPALLPTLENPQLQSIYTPPKPQESMTSIRDAEGKIFSPRLIAMIGFFIALIAILLGVLYMNDYIGPKDVLIPTPSVQQTIQEPAVNLDEIPESTIESIPSATSSGVTAATDSANIAGQSAIQNNIKIEVLNGSGVTGKAEDVQEVLLSKGFSTVTTGNTPAVSQRTIIFHNPTVTVSTLTAIIEGLSTVEIESSVQENAELTSIDVRIVIGQ